jgi:hypothetical protein
LPPPPAFWLRTIGLLNIMINNKIKNGINIYIL